MTAWFDALDQSCAVVVAPASHFAQRFGQCALADFPRRETGVRRLCDILLAYAEADIAEGCDDWDFVEGGGALLTLLLIDYHTSCRVAVREGTLRLRLGEHGWFDPFAAIEHSLEGDDIRRAFAKELAIAEADAAGTGPGARVLEAFETLLRQTRPDLTIASQFEHELVLSNGAQIDLRRVISATSTATPLEVKSAVRAVVDVLADSGAALVDVSWQQARTQIFPRLVSLDFLDGLDDSLNERCRLMARPLGGDVSIALVLRYPDRIKYVGHRALEHWDTTVDVAYQVALGNLVEHSAQAKFFRLDTDYGPLMMARNGDGLDASRLLLPGLHALLSKELGSDCVAAAPHRDALMASAGAPVGLIDALRHTVTDAAMRAPHRISTQLWHVCADGLPRVATV